MDNATRRQILERVKQLGYPNTIEALQNPQVLDQYEQQQLQAQSQQQQQQQPIQQPEPVSFPTPPATTSNYKVPQPTQSEAKPLVMSFNETAPQLMRSGGIKFDKGGPTNPNSNPDQVLTYKDNPEWFDNRAIYSGDDRYDAQIRKLVYEGKGGYNPHTRTLHFLKPDQQTKVDETTKAYSKDKRTQTAEDKKLIASDAGKKHILNTAEDFVQKSALATAALAAPLALPSGSAVMGALEAPLVIGGTTVPGVTAGGTLGAAFGGMGVNEFANPNEETNISIGKAIDNPTYENLKNASINSAISGTNFLGLGMLNEAKPFIKGIGQSAKSAKEYFNFRPKTSANFNSVFDSNFNLDELRSAYHNSQRFLNPEEVRYLHKHGHGNPASYVNDTPTDNFTTDELEELYNTRIRNRFSEEELRNTGWGTANWNPNNPTNQLPAPPSEIHFMPDGTTRSMYNQPATTDYIDLRRPSSPLIQRGLFGRDLGGDGLPGVDLASHYAPTKKTIVNKSGLTKEEVLATATEKDKDVISKMSENEFAETVLKPTGEVVPYYQGDLMPQFTGNNSVFALPHQTYADEFNSRLDLLNEIIAKNNKSGVEYRVKELNPQGQLVFYTPKQEIPRTLTAKQKANLEWYERDPLDFAVNKGGLKQLEDGKWAFSDDVIDESFKTKEDALEFLNKQVTENLKGGIPIEGESSWSVGINPGQWRGNVEDIASSEYLKSIPGLEMRNTMAGVFPDRKARRGTKTYESVNEYLKKLDLGRVKPGFNSQTEYSKGAWENFIKSGKGVGYYANPGTVYGAMKSMAPIIGAGYVGSELYQRQQQQKPVTKQFVSFKTGGKKCYTCNSSKMKVLYNKANYKK
jgi:hypothetical protein